VPRPEHACHVGRRLHVGMRETAHKSAADLSNLLTAVCFDMVVLIHAWGPAPETFFFVIEMKSVIEDI
jgi:hypothetical protein